MHVHAGPIDLARPRKQTPHAGMDQVRDGAVDVRTSAGVGGRSVGASDDEGQRERGGEQHSRGEQATQSSCVQQEVVIPSDGRTSSGRG